MKRDHKNKIIIPSLLEEKILQLRQQHKKIVTVNGSFDLLHAGHLYILSQASKLAEILIVALNSDISIKGYKSPSRPIVSLPNRLEMMAAIEYVDYVTWFDELDPCKILGIIKPDVHVNGIEYGENCIESQVVAAGGGTLHLVQRIGGLATSEIIKKILHISEK
jgi:D-glycero-beta-D-manno-heptose 1-phosphate adenylyltransferase